MEEQSYGFIPFCKGDRGFEVFLIYQYGSAGGVRWTFPKGRSEAGEAPIETAFRELKEETGLEMASYDVGNPLSTSYTFMRNNIQIEKTATYFIGFVSYKEFVIQPEEVKEASWFTVEEAREKLISPDYKKLLDNALALLDK